MKASDLPDEIKNELLTQIRQQLGQAQYDILVENLGKDGLIDAVLDQVNYSNNALSSQKESHLQHKSVSRKEYIVNPFTASFGWALLILFSPAEGYMGCLGWFGLIIYVLVLIFEPTMRPIFLFALLGLVLSFMFYFIRNIIAQANIGTTDNINQNTALILIMIILSIGLIWLWDTGKIYVSP